jgi:antitoxin (DNA-binding transcriptional repressor) of toxin-antitoxin stability system
MTDPNVYLRHGRSAVALTPLPQQPDRLVRRAETGWWADRLEELIRRASAWEPLFEHERGR